MRLFWSYLIVRCVQFQSTHPHGVRQATLIHWRFGLAFQSTHPHGVRQRLAYPLGVARGFNPRTRTGCDLPELAIAAGQLVSIHAPARGATRHLSLTFLICPVSIHAPARGATYGTAGNPQIQQVSIHAPARGATGRPPVSATTFTSFNPRTRTGCDRDWRRSWRGM